MKIFKSRIYLKINHNINKMLEYKKQLVLHKTNKSNKIKHQT